MILKRSDIAPIPFPFSDLTRQKRRPVLLLTPPDALGDFLAAAITSQAGHNDAILHNPKSSCHNDYRVPLIIQSSSFRRRPESSVFNRLDTYNRLGKTNWGYTS